MSFRLVHVAAFTLLSVLTICQFSIGVNATFLAGTLLPKLGLKNLLSPITQALQVKGCSQDKDISSPDDQTLTGRIVVQDCACEKKFATDAWRITAVEASVTTQLQTYYQQLYNTKITYIINLKLVDENSTHTLFNFTVKVPKADHDKARPCILKAWNDDQVKKTIQQASLSYPDDHNLHDKVDSDTPAKYTCNPTCQNGGECTKQNTCTCTRGFSGPTCAIESAGLCSDTDTFTGKPIVLIDFGAGSQQYSTARPSDFHFSTTYEQQFAPQTCDGNFSFVNSVHDDFSGAWHTGAKDHTGNQGGYMFLVNADFNPGQFYNGTVDNLSIGLRYEFSVYVANLMVVTGIEPNILFEVRSPTLQNRLLAQLSSGDIPISTDMTWLKYGLSFTAPSSLVTLLMISNAPGGYGNDLAIDDIALRVCSPGGASDSSPSTSATSPTTTTTTVSTTTTTTTTPAPTTTTTTTTPAPTTTTTTTTTTPAPAAADDSSSESDTNVSISPCASCNQYNYELEGNGLIHDTGYTCDDNPKNLLAGHCILSLTNAVQQCDKDPQCGGFGTCTDDNWHSTFDHDGLPGVQLFGKGSASNANVEWSSYIKGDPK